MTTDRYQALLPRPRTARRTEGSYELTPDTPLVAARGAEAFADAVRLRLCAPARADVSAARVGGTASALGMLDAMAGAPIYAPLISGVCEPGHALHEWRTGIAVERARNADRMARLRQLTIRRASLFASHSTIGRRHQFLMATPPQPAAVTVTESEFTQITKELSPYAERLRRDLAEQYEM